jgi:hypothetical protein
MSLRLSKDRATLPLSSVHYIEMSRVSNVDRKVRLGTAMWHFSKGKTIIGYPAIVRHEFETALAKHVPRVKPGKLQLIGKGHAHRFCPPSLEGLLKWFEEDVERGSSRWFDSIRAHQLLCNPKLVRANPSDLDSAKCCADDVSRPSNTRR